MKIVDGTTPEQVEESVLNYFDDQAKVRTLIYKHLDGDVGFTSNPILLSYGVINKFYKSFYDKFPQAEQENRLLVTVGTLAALEKEGEELLSGLKNTENVKAYLAGCGAFNGDNGKVSIGTSIQKIGLFNDISISYSSFIPVIRSIEDKKLKDRLVRNIFITTSSGRKILNNLVEGLSAKDSNNVTTQFVETQLKELPPATYEDLTGTEQKEEYTANSESLIKQYITTFTVKIRDTSYSDTQGYILRYTPIDKDEVYTQVFRKITSADESYETWLIDTPLTFKENSKFEILPDSTSNTNMAKPNIIKYFTTGSAADPGISERPFSIKGAGSAPEFNANWSCSAVRIRVQKSSEKTKTLSTLADGLTFIGLKQLSNTNEPEQKPEEKSKEKQKRKPKPQEATIDNNTKPKSGPRRTKIGDKDLTQIRLWAEEFTNKLTDPNVDKKALLDEYRNKLESTYTRDALAIIPTLFKGVGMLTKYRRFATMAQNLGTKSNNNIQI